MEKGINVLSLFDGMSCGQIALERAGIKVNQYFASEIDKHAIKVTQHNYPKTIQLGSVVDVCDMVLPDIDLLIGGSPCQGFSFAGKLLNFEDIRSKLFFEYVRLLKELRAHKPDMFFLLENVRMKKESGDVISEYLGVKPVFICSSNFSASKRKRLYWTNIPGIQELKQNNLGLNIQDIMDSSFSEKSDYLNDIEIKRGVFKHSAQTLKTGTKMGSVKFPTPITEKSKCLNTVRIKGDRTMTHIDDGVGIRLLNPIEYERLQNVPDNYTSLVPIAKRFHMLGNGWTVDVIADIFKGLKTE